MDGLDIEEIYKSNLENSFTIGAEYYGKRFVNAANCVKKINHKTLQEISDIITDGDHGSSNYQQSGVLYLLSESVHQGYIDILKCRYISEEKNKELHRSELHPNDIVVTKTGVYFGKSAVITNKIEKANMIAHVGKISLKNSYNPFFVSTFLNCKYGYYQLRRRGIKATRPEIKLVEFSDIIIPVFSGVIEHCIEEIINKALQLMDFANSIIKQCENDIALCVAGKNCIVSCNYAIKPFSKTFELTGRLDAEYYQPKYDRLFSTLSKYTCKPLGGENGLVLFKKSIEPGSEYYQSDGVPFIRVSDISKFEIEDPEIHLPLDIVDNIEDLYPEKDTILFSKDGSVGIAYKVEDRMEIITSGALLHLTIKNQDEILPDYLTLVLNSPIVQLQAERDTNGAIIQHWKPSEIEKVVIPVLDMDKQIEISDKVKESFALRKKSKQLLEDAKRAVEIAIEQDEESAIIWLKDRVDL